MLETCRELYINILKGIFASSWTITKNHCIMHGQQNVKSSDIDLMKFLIVGDELYRTDGIT